MARNKYDVDESLESQFDFAQLKRLFSYAGPYRGTLVFVIIIMLLSSALGMLLPKFMTKVLDEYIPNEDMHGIIIISCITLAIVVFNALMVAVKIKLMSEVGQGIIHRLRTDLFDQLQRLPFSYYDSRPHGKIQVRLVNYVNNLSDLLSNGLVNTVTDLCSLIFIVCFMLSMNVKLTLYCLLGLPVLYTLVFVIKRKQRKAWQLQSNKQSNLNAFIAESINGVRVTQAFVREDHNTGIFNRLSGDYRKAWMRAVRYNFLLSPVIDTISIFTSAAVYFIGVSWISGQTEAITVGILVAFSSYIGRFWQPINTLASFYNSMLTAMSYLERIFETIDEPVNIKDAPDAGIMPPIQGRVEFRDVEFSYEDGVKILNKINFTASVGQTFAIVGPTGAGKTTIVNLLSRFYNVDSGAILVDDVDISKVTIHSLRTQMGVMMQDSFIFSGTIMDNIRYGNMEATDEQVVEAAKAVCAHEFIMGMEEGYQTPVNERGTRLSQGQRQLISFARALLADPKILILDEATSSIDTETELLLQQGLARLLAGRTSFIIAHRLSTIKNADCIMYIDHGRIVEKGNHAELLEQKGEYYNLYMSQYAFLEQE